MATRWRCFLLGSISISVPLIIKSGEIHSLHIYGVAFFFLKEDWCIIVLE